MASCGSGNDLRVLAGSCHCGAVKVTLTRKPRSLTSCNCSICYRYGTLWAYYDRGQVTITPRRGATSSYTWGGKRLRFVRCATCGCIINWEAVDRSRRRMGVNLRNFDHKVVASIRVRRLDGAKTWKFLD